MASLNALSPCSAAAPELSRMADAEPFADSAPSASKPYMATLSARVAAISERAIDLDRYALRVGSLLERSMQRYSETGNPAYRAHAQIWADLMALALARRPAEKVRLLEAERGLQ